MDTPGDAPFLIRRASTDDIPLIRSLADVVFRDTYRAILSPDQMEYMMDWMYSESSLEDQMCRLGHRYLLAGDRGYASFRKEGLTGDGRDLFHLEKIYILPSEKGKGLGRRLFEAVADCIRSISPDHPRMELNVNRNNPSLGFYEHLGMRKVRSGDFPIGHGFYMNDYIMGIDL